MRYSSALRGPRAHFGRSRSRGRSRAHRARPLLGIPARLNAVGRDNASTGLNRKDRKISFSRDTASISALHGCEAKGRPNAPNKAPEEPFPNVQIPPVKETPPARSWAAVTRSTSKGYGLSFVPPATIENSKILQMPEEILESSHPKWEECLVGYYIGKRLPFHLIEDALKNAWGHHLVEVIAADLGFYFFHIPDSDFRRKILDGGPITVAKIPLILQQWHPMLELKKLTHNSVPIWIRLRNVLVALWSVAGISFLASGIGKPLFVDNRTEQMAMVAFARVCIEVDTSNSFPEVIEFMMKGELRTVTVQYEWIPTICPTCSSFGHRCPAPNSSSPSKPGPSVPKAPVPRPNEWREVRGKRNKHTSMPANDGLMHDLVQNHPKSPRSEGIQIGDPMPQITRQEDHHPSFDLLPATSIDPVSAAVMQR
ncbi:hypothetical protein ACJRO7_031536 [Eucalyptus globulus]|uniref:DUF4283 domain-containing protein n=1 Tax=Eucalyptus globulus TaxID=34317 RepID=A0ABD3JQQ9_EUCGL